MYEYAAVENLQLAQQLYSSCLRADAWSTACLASGMSCVSHKHSSQRASGSVGRAHVGTLTRSQTHFRASLHAMHYTTTNTSWGPSFGPN